jgi:hypothetical protein
LETFAVAIATRAASHTEANAPPNPTRIGLDGPPRLEATTRRDSSINTHSVFVPPPSSPKT